MKLFLRAGILLSLFTRVWAASVSDLVGGMDAYQCWGRGSTLMLLDCKSGQNREVVSVGGNVSWAGGPNRDATKITFEAGGGIYVVDWDGGNLKRVASGNSPHFLGTDQVVYVGGGGTYKVRINASNNEPGGSTKLSGTQCEAGITGNGRYLAETYRRSFMIEISTGKQSPHFNNSQNCSGSAHPGNKVQMMFNRDPGHNAMVIGEWDPGSNSTRIVWSYGGSEIFGLWSVNHENFGVFGEHDKNFKLVRISDKQSAGINIGGVYCGGPWVGNRGNPEPPPPPPPEDDTPPSAPSNLSATADGKTKINLSWDEASDDESGIKEYNIYRNGEKVGTTENTSYTDDGLSEGTTYKYQVSAVNGEDMEGEKSNESSATTEADNDTSPPEPTSAIAQSATSVKVSFNEPVTQESAENTGNYAISGGITVGGASLQGDNTSVVLTTSTLTEKTSYTVTVSNIIDRSPNANSGGGQADFMLSGEIQISNLSVGSGKAYEIVEAIAEGDKQYIDRDYTYSSLGDCAGMAYIRTANNDKSETGESFLSFDINTGATIHVAYRHGSDLPPWLSSWSKTGNQVCGDGCSDVYEKDFNAGTVTLGGNMPGGAGNMYTVFVDGGGGTTFSSRGSRHAGAEKGAFDAAFKGAVLQVSGVQPEEAYRVTLTDARGKVWSLKCGSNVHGALSLSLPRHAPGMYFVTIRSRSYRYNATTMLSK